MGCLERETTSRNVLVFACQPNYGGGHPESHRMFWSGGLRKGSPLMNKVVPVQYSSSYNAGNLFLASALNAQENGVKITHLAMLHNDVVPEQGWIDVLMEDLLAFEMDVMSAVIPIKDMKGLTSTAIDSEDDPYEVERRLTMTEVFSLPPVFTNKDCGYPHRNLLVNTGCFIMDFTKPWRYDLCFTATDRIIRNNGKMMSQHSPSDWQFSRDVQRFGGKVAATRNVRLLHMAELPYHNHEPWGDWKVDLTYKHHFNGQPIQGDTVSKEMECPSLP